VLHIGNAATPCHHQYTLQQAALELLENIRDLGINMDSKLKFRTHTDTVTSKANRILGLIYKVFECKDSDIILNFYKSLVWPLLEYNNAIWGPQFIMDKQKVEAIQ